MVSILLLGLKIALLVSFFDNTFASHDCIWNGGSGYWFDSSSWTPKNVPDSSCRVIVGNLSYSDTLTISGSVNIYDLEIMDNSLGNVYISSNTSISITHDFYYNGGNIVGENSDNSVIIINGTTQFTNTQSPRRYIRSVSIIQNLGSMIMHNLNLVMSNSSIVISKSAVLSCISSTTNTISIKNDASRLYFDEYKRSVMNQRVNLQLTNPVQHGAYDIIYSQIPDSVNATISASTVGPNIYTWLETTEYSSMAQTYYAYHVNAWQPGEYKSELYNRSVSGVDYDQCSIICNSYNWCKSFDHYSLTSSCLLSGYYFREIGGLATDENWTHYERRISNAVGVSSIIINGDVVFSGFASPRVFISVDFIVEGRVFFNDSTVTFSREFNIRNGSLIFFGQCKLNMTTSLSSFKLSQNAKILKSLKSDTISLTYDSGSHLIAGTIDGNSSIELSNFAMVQLFATSNSTNVYNIIKLTDKSTLMINSNLNLLLRISELNLRNGSQLLGDNLNISSSSVSIDTSSSLSSNGMGFSHGEGPTPGIGNNIGSSGGSHGGLGGVGKVDTLGSPYGSAIYPITRGSGGGRCLWSPSTSGGEGGGIIHLNAERIVLDGLISSNGNNGGLTCHGGGAGGSIYLKSGKLSGVGIIAAKGGNGGFAGGNIVAGAGSGGRIAIVSSLYSFSGTFDASGGYRPQTSEIDIENAGAGTVYVNACIQNGTVNSSKIETCSLVQAIIVSPEPTSNYSGILIARERLLDIRINLNSEPKQESLPHLIYPRVRGAYLFDSTPSYDPTIELDLHVLGPSPLVLAGKSLKIGRIVAANSPYIQLRNNISFSISQQNFSLQGCSIYVENAYIENLGNINIGSGGQLVLYNRTLEFESLVLQNFGRVIVLNSSVTLKGKQMTVSESGGLITITNNLILNVSMFNVYNGIFCNTYGSRRQVEVVISPNTNVYILGNLYLLPTVKISLLGALLIGAGGLIDINYATNNSFIIGQSQSHGRVSVLAGGRINVMNNSNVSIYSDIDLQDGSFTLSVSSSLYLREGQTNCLGNRSIYLDLGSQLIVDSSAKFSMAHCINAFQGPGHVIIQGKGKLFPASRLVKTLPNITVLNEGEVVFGNQSSEISFISNFFVESCITISSGGLMILHNNTEIIIQNMFSLSGGIIHLETQSSRIRISANIVYYSGLIYGNGIITIDSSGSLNCMSSNTDISSNNYSPLLHSQLTILDVNIVNNGYIAISNITINSARTSTFINKGIVNIANIKWISDTRLFGFQLYRSYTKADGLTLIGVGYYNNISSTSCAEICQSMFLRTSRLLLATQDYVDEVSPCVGFYYQQKLSQCQLRTKSFDNELKGLVPIELPDYDIKLYDDNEDFYWDLYVLNSKSSSEFSQIQNEQAGVLNISVSSYSSINVPIRNNGSIIIPESSKLYINSGFEHNTVGIVNLEGKLILTGPILSEKTHTNNSLPDIGVLNIATEIRGSFSGSGVLNFDGDIYLQSNLISYNLDLIISGDVQVTDVKELFVKSLNINKSGSLHVSNTPLNLTTNGAIIVEGSLTTSRIISEYWNTSNGLIGLECSSCYDLLLSSPSLTVNGSGHIIMSMGLILSPLIMVYNGTISSSGRGYSNTLMSRSYRNSNVSLWAGVHGFLGSSGGSHGGRGGLGFGTQYNPNDGFIESSSTDKYVDQKNQYYHRQGIMLSSYDSYFNYLAWGAPGGYWQVKSLSTSGGGSLRIFGQIIENNGQIMSDGESPLDSLGGGGAGGSILIVGNTLRGNGKISASGGNGGRLPNVQYGQGGGGGGGRIVLIVNDISDYKGSNLVVGGTGFENGSAGTLTLFKNTESYGSNNIFDNLPSSLISTEKGQLIIDNNGIQTFLFTVFLPDDTNFGSLESIYLFNGAKLNIALFGDSLRVNNLVSDGTGSILLSNGSYLRAYQNSSFILTALNLTILNASVAADNLIITDGSSIRLTELGSISSKGDSIIPGSYFLSNLYVNSNSTVEVSYTDCCTNLVNINISESLIIEYGSNMNSNGQSSKLISYTVGGGGHGGKGGQSMTGIGQSEYGNLTNPLTFGSAGGGTIYSSSGGGIGGGVLYLKVKNLVLNGSISVDGTDAYLAGGSGGSGGSIHLNVNQISGIGSLTANGGAGLYSNSYFGSGGGGGRIAIFCATCEIKPDPLYAALRTDNKFSLAPYFYGRVQANGGVSLYRSENDSGYRPEVIDQQYDSGKWLSTQPTTASAGTVYLELQSSFRYVIIENTQSIAYTLYGGFNNYLSTTYYLSPSSTTLLPVPSNLSIDGLFLLRHATIEINKSSKLSISSLHDDGHCEIVISEGGHLIIKDNTTLSQINITLFGSLTGSNNIHLTNKSQVGVYPTASWSGSLSTAPSATINISTLTLSNASRLIIYGGTEYQFQAKQYIYCDSLVIQDKESVVSADGQGYSASGIGGSVFSEEVYVTTYQANGNVTLADGGWHAGRGGGRIFEYLSDGIAYTPLLWGRSGGSTFSNSGHNGGGLVRIVASHSIVNNGVISADGESCNNIESTAGGGAGGSVWLSVVSGNLTGSGTISVAGGNGCLNGGGGGSAGRIAVWDSARGSSFSGTFSMYSGTQNNSTELYSPSGGTLFLSYSNGSQGVLVATNHGQGGSPITIRGNAFTNYSIVDKLEAIYLVDSNLSLPSVVTFSHTVSQLKSNENIYPGSLFSIPNLANASQSHLILNNGAVLILGHENITTIETNIITDKAALFYSSDVSISSRLTISPFQTCLKIVSNTYSEAINADSLISLCGHWDLTPGDSSDILNNITFSNLVVTRSGSILFSSVTDPSYLNKSVAVNADIINVEAGGTIDGSGVFQSINNRGVLSSFGTSATSGTGGGNGGDGTDSYKNSKRGLMRGDPFYPIGGGGAGGFGKLESGGEGGLGLYIVSTELIVNGIISVSGHNPSIGSGGGGGAGGSLFIVTGSLNGNGSIEARGGHGSVSPSSLVHGGAGSGGRIAVISYSPSAFTGRFDARGGLTIRQSPTVSLLRSNSVISYQSQQQLYSAAPGTIIQYSISENSSNMKSLTFFDQISLLNTSADLFITSWTDLDVNLIINQAQGNITVRNSDLEFFENVAISLQHPSVYELSGIVIPSTETILEFPNSKINSRLSLIVLKNSTLRIQGHGLFDAQIKGDGKSSIIFSGNITYSSSNNPWILEDISWSFEQCSSVANNLRLNVSLKNSILFFNRSSDCMNNTDLKEVVFHPTNDSYLSPLPGVGTISLGYPYSLYIETLTLEANSSIKGSFIAIRAASVFLKDNSSITTDGLGYEGGAIINSKPTSGSGRGGGGTEDIGGNGGAYGGQGGFGLRALYRLSQYSLTLANAKSSNSKIATNISALISNASLGLEYGDFRYPIHFGSGGGAVRRSNGRGGNGGGILIMDVPGNILVSHGCSISSDGESVMNGGGAGAGGSVYFTSSPGALFGSGKISARGGSVCFPTNNCTTDVNYPGGFGGGGRVRIDRDTSEFTGNISALSGASSGTTDIFLGRFHGSVVDMTSSAELYAVNQSPTDLRIDVVTPMPTIRLIQVISTSGVGLGDRNASNEIDAVIKGFWKLGFRSSYSRVTLTSQATASEVLSVIETFNGVGHVNVARRSNSNNGWTWSVTFFDDMTTTDLLDVNGIDLYTVNKFSTNNTAKISIQLLSPLSAEYDSYSSLTLDQSDAYTPFTYSEVVSLVGFNIDLYDASTTYGYWPRLNTFRIKPKSSAFLSNHLDVLRIKYLSPVPTSRGFLSGLLISTSISPTMQPSSFPSSNPTRQPSSQPSCSPSISPSNSPTSMPSSQPSNSPSSFPSLPSSQPSPRPSTQPSSEPSLQPTCQPSAQPSSPPSGQPSYRPTHPSSQPTALPSFLPSSKPSSQPSVRPSQQPSAWPTSKPSTQPSSFPTSQPSSLPSLGPSSQPSNNPSTRPTTSPSSQPSTKPSNCPSVRPTSQPSSRPSSQPSQSPSIRPTRQPSSSKPSKLPSSLKPTNCPSSEPSEQPTL